MLGRCSCHHQFPVCSSGGQFEPEVNLMAVGWYLRFSLRIQLPSNICEANFRYRSHHSRSL
jgi:hypothetical protein